MSATKIILDTDMGMDDAWALITLLQCEQRCNLSLKAITIVAGNTSRDHASQNTLLVLKTLKRDDVKVYAGAKDSLIIKPDFKSNYHGEDGFQGIFKAEEKPSLDLLQKEHAVEAMKNLIEENPHEIVIFAIGPLTNLALLFKMYPNVISKIKSLHIMGGNIHGVGNITRCAEFNFWYDPEAAQIVINEANCPIYILPWEPCKKASLEMPHQGFRFGTMNSFGSDITSLMDKIEVDAHYFNNFIPCDAFLIACFAFPEMIRELKKHHVEIELNGSISRGQMIIDHRCEKSPNVHVIENFDIGFFKNVLCWVCGHDIEGF